MRPRLRKIACVLWLWQACSSRRPSSRRQQRWHGTAKTEECRFGRARARLGVECASTCRAIGRIQNGPTLVRVVPCRARTCTAQPPHTRRRSSAAGARAAVGNDAHAGHSAHALAQHCAAITAAALLSLRLACCSCTFSATHRVGTTYSRVLKSLR
jgi:hypothetical protein